MLQLDELSLPAAVRDAVVDLESEVDVQRYSNKGANGHLFFGEHRIMHRRVAVKFYFWAGDRTHDEPRVLSEIQSSHVMPVYAARFVDDEWAMFQTPYYPRGDIDQVLARARFSLHQAIDHGIEVLAGVSALHEANCVHRDLKPENIFIDDEGRARIGDFGSARVLPKEGGEVPGSGHSVLYRPPESFEPGSYGRAGDLYQCGIVLYQLLGGFFPYEAQHWLDREGQRCWDTAVDDFEESRCLDGAVYRKARRARLLDFNSLSGAVPPGLKTIVRKAAHPKPTARHAAPSHMISDLRRIRGQCFDWLDEGNQVTAAARDRRVRLVREGAADAVYQPECDKGSGWRKMQGVSAAPLGHVARTVERHLG